MGSMECQFAIVLKHGKIGIFEFQEKKVSRVSSDQPKICFSRQTGKKCRPNCQVSIITDGATLCGIISYKSLRSHLVMLLTPKIIQPVETRCETYLGHLNGTTAHQDIAPSEKKKQIRIIFHECRISDLGKKRGEHTRISKPSLQVWTLCILIQNI